MRAHTVGSMIALLVSVSALAVAQENAAPQAEQVASCPTILPVAEGERSIIVPTLAAQQPPHVASRTPSHEQSAEVSLLRSKLAERDRLQREIEALRTSTQTPEQICVQLRIFEVNCTKARQLNVDWASAGGADSTKFNLAALLGAGDEKTLPTLNIQTDLDPSALEFVAALEKQNLCKVHSAPTVVVTSGRPAAIEIGGEFPIPQPAPLGGVKIQKYGTQINVTASSLGNNRVRLDLGPRISEIDHSRSITVGDQVIPALSVRQCDTCIEMELGRTSLLTGLNQHRVVSKKTGWLGQTQEDVEEIALVIAVTPDYVR